MIVRCLNIFILCNKGPRLYTDNKDIRQQKVLDYPLIFRMIREYVQDTEMLSNRNIGTYPTTGYRMTKAYKDLFALNTIKCVTWVVGVCVFDFRARDEHKCPKWASVLYLLKPALEGSWETSALEITLWNCSLTRLSAQLIVILIAHSFTVFTFTKAISISRYYEEVLLPNHRFHVGLSGASRVCVKLNLLVRIFHAHFFIPQRLNRLRCLITLWKNVPFWGPFMELFFSFSCTWTGVFLTGKVGFQKVRARLFLCSTRQEVCMMIWSKCGLEPPKFYLQLSTEKSSLCITMFLFLFTTQVSKQS